MLELPKPEPRKLQATVMGHVVVACGPFPSPPPEGWWAALEAVAAGVPSVLNPLAEVAAS